MSEEVLTSKDLASFMKWSMDKYYHTPKEDLPPAIPNSGIQRRYLKSEVLKWCSSLSEDCRRPHEAL